MCVLWDKNSQCITKFHMLRNVIIKIKMKNNKCTPGTGYCVLSLIFVLPSAVRIFYQYT